MMRVSKSVAEWLLRRRALDGKEIGFVPTMGALHRGHASLVERSRKENEITAVSIFVNPAQFNDPRDFQRYPRTTERDLYLLRDLGVDEVFTPSAEELYPHGYRFHIEENTWTRLMDGISRPGHFQGVMTVVLKLLNLIRPSRAYFGEKDYQQLRLIEDMCREFFIPTHIIGCPTVREESGLALSSRNDLLSAEARAKAALIVKALREASSSVEARDMLDAGGFKVDYVEEYFGRRFAAAFLDGVRLIDNVQLNPGS